jgi:hypothetical protein
VFYLDPLGQLRAYERTERELNRRLEVIRQLRDNPNQKPRRLRDAVYLRIGDWLITIGVRLKAVGTRLTPPAVLSPPDEDGSCACANGTSPA